MNARERRRFSLAWLGILAALGLLACGSCWLAIQGVRKADDSRLLLAVSRQRMLSQRVALLAHQYVAVDDDYERLDLRWELRACSAEMRRTLDQHLNPGRAAADVRGTDPLDAPLTERPLSDAVTALYNDAPIRVSSRIRELSASVDELCNMPPGQLDKALAKAAQVEANSTAVLPGMDALGEQLQSEHEAAIETQVSLQYKLLGGMLIGLGLAGVLLARTRVGRRQAVAAAQRAALSASSAQRASNQPVASTPASPPLSTSGSKTA